MNNKTSKKKTILGYYNYFYNLIKNKLFVIIVLNIAIGLLDGLSIVMFIPLLGVATGSTNSSEVGQLQFILDWFAKIHLPLNLQNILLIMVVFFTIKGCLNYFKQVYSLKIRQHIVRKMRFNLVDKMHSLTYRGFTGANPGQIQHGMISEALKLVRSMGAFTTFTQDGVILFVFLGLAFVSNLQFALLLLVAGILTSLLYTLLNKATLKNVNSLSRLHIKFNGHLMQIIQNFKYLKATNVFNSYKLYLKDLIKEAQQQNLKLGKVKAFINIIREPIVVLIISGVILIYVNIFKQSFGTILVSLFLFYKALNILISLQGKWNDFLEQSVSITVVEDLITYFENNSENSNYSSEFSEKINSIQLKNIDIKFENTQILNNINLNITNKQTIAFVGESGSGKTTLINVISGLLYPDNGHLVVNNQIASNLDIKSYRDRIGYITQEPVIFNDNIYNNVTLWSEKNEENLQRFWHCLKLAHLNEFVQQLELKEQAPLGNGGILISGGQKQRISIARELYRDVDVLIMDEATSALDAETEREIQQNIDELQGKYTMIVVAHRLSTIKKADVIYLMQNGEIIEQGNYNELTQKSPQFQKMVSLQQLN